MILISVSCQHLANPHIGLQNSIIVQNVCQLPVSQIINKNIRKIKSFNRNWQEFRSQPSTLSVMEGSFHFIIRLLWCSYMSSVYPSVAALCRLAAH